jgi:hypothetical protein
MASVPTGTPPDGYVALSVGEVEAVASEAYVDAITAVLRSRAGSLHDFARLHFESRALHGRSTAYSAPLPGMDTRVVVRHNQHGGLLAPFTRDLFRPPTRAPFELDASLRLRYAGVPTPEIVAYAVYPAPLGMRRADVATREIVDSFDLSAVLTHPTSYSRQDAWDAIAELLRRLAAAGARHHDLNIKNVLLRSRGGPLDAFILDVDRITFEAGDVTAANLARLSRSARKWRDRHGAVLDESELTALARAVFEPAHAITPS